MKKLKVLITNSKSGAFHYIASGWVRAFNGCGHDAKLWDGDRATWHKVKPDIFIGCSGWKQSIPPKHIRGDTKIAIHVNPWCSETIKAGGPVINEQRAAISWTLAQKPDLVFGYGLQEDINKYWSKWKDQGIKAIGMPNAADALLYRRVAKDPAHSVDIGWVGGYWNYKAINLNKYLLPVARKFDTIWYGHSGPKERFYRGKVHGEDLVLKLFSSAKICPAVVEPHTTEYGIDIPERIFKLSAIGAMIISDPVRGLDRYFPNDVGLVVAKNRIEFIELCHKWIKASADDRRKKSDIIKKHVLKHHTYFNRIKRFMSAFGYEDESAAVDRVIDRLLVSNFG